METDNSPSSPLKDINITDKLSYRKKDYIKESTINGKEANISEKNISFSLDEKVDNIQFNVEKSSLKVDTKKYSFAKAPKEKEAESYLSHLYQSEKIIPLGLTFDDVLLIPQYSSINSRGQINLNSKFSRNVPLRIPFISSPMDTVTESGMAIEMARCGGLGIIHRFNTVEQQVEEVEKVKRILAYVIPDPYTIHLNVTVGKLKLLVKKMGTQTFLVTEETFCVGDIADFSFKHKLIGLVTRRDLRKAKDDLTKIKEIMTPREKITIIDEHSQDLLKAKEVMISKGVEKLPVVNEKNEILGLITLRDINRIEDCPQANVDSQGKLYVGAAIGANKDYLERSKKLIDAGCDVLVVDIANGHSQICIEAVERLKEQFTIDVVAGSIATGDGAERLIKVGADGIRCGIGSGSICTTRIVAGAGVPQLSALLDAAPICLNYGVPLISDGGNRCSGNMCKALGAGASAVMLGRLIAGCDESPGTLLLKDGKKVKIYRGMAGLGANMAKAEKNSGDINLATFNAEGVEGYIPYIGPLKETLFQFSSGIKSGMSYCGAASINEMPDKAKFIRLTQSAIFESGVHDINKF